MKKYFTIRSLFRLVAVWIISAVLIPPLFVGWNILVISIKHEHGWSGPAKANGEDCWALGATERANAEAPKRDDFHSVGDYFDAYDQFYDHHRNDPRYFSCGGSSYSWKELPSENKTVWAKKMYNEALNSVIFGPFLLLGYTVGYTLYGIGISLLVICAFPIALAVILGWLGAATPLEGILIIFKRK